MIQGNSATTLNNNAVSGDSETDEITIPQAQRPVTTREIHPVESDPFFYAMVSLSGIHYLSPGITLNFDNFLKHRAIRNFHLARVNLGETPLNKAALITEEKININDKEDENLIVNPLADIGLPLFAECSPLQKQLYACLLAHPVELQLLREGIIQWTDASNLRGCPIFVMSSATVFSEHMQCRFVLGDIEYGVNDDVLMTPNKSNEGYYSGYEAAIYRLKLIETRGDFNELCDLINNKLIEFQDFKKTNIRRFREQDFLFQCLYDYNLNRYITANNLSEQLISNFEQQIDAHVNAILSNPELVEIIIHPELLTNNSHTLTHLIEKKDQRLGASSQAAIPIGDFGNLVETTEEKVLIAKLCQQNLITQSSQYTPLGFPIYHINARAPVPFTFDPLNCKDDSRFSSSYEDALERHLKFEEQLDAIIEVLANLIGQNDYYFETEKDKNDEVAIQQNLITFLNQHAQYEPAATPSFTENIQNQHKIDEQSQTPPNREVQTDQSSDESDSSDSDCSASSWQQNHSIKRSFGFKRHLYNLNISKEARSTYYKMGFPIYEPVSFRDGQLIWDYKKSQHNCRLSFPSSDSMTYWYYGLLKNWYIELITGNKQV